MATINCYVPLKLRLAGDMREEDWSALEDALVHQYTRALRRSLAQLQRTRPGNELARELYDPRRLGLAGYNIPSYEDGEPTEVPVQGPSLSAMDLMAIFPSGYDDKDIIQTTYRQFRANWQPGAYFGLYVSREAGPPGPKLYYLVAGKNGKVDIRWIRLFTKDKQTGERVDMALAGGVYTLVFRAGAVGQLSRNGGSRRNINNVDNMNITVTFIVPGDPGFTVFSTPLAKAPQPSARRVPRVRIYDLRGEQAAVTGGTAQFEALTQIVEVEPNGSWHPVDQRIYTLSARVYHHWQIYLLPEGDVQPPPPFSADTFEPYVSYQWPDVEGTYEIVCRVRVEHGDVDSMAVTDRRHQFVIDLSKKQAYQIAAWEAAAKEHPEQRVWFQTDADLLQFYRKQLAEAQAEPGDYFQERAKYLADLIEKMEEHLHGHDVQVRFPIPAVFTDRKTSKTVPMTLLLAPDPDNRPGANQRWYLIDLTYPAFYATYKGDGPTASAAILDAFETHRTKFKTTYPPGQIMARIYWPGMERWGVVEHTFTISTESWQKTAHEYLTFITGVVSLLILPATFVFPPAWPLTAVLVGTALAGIALTIDNIVERVQTDSFSWDMQTFQDLVNIAASLAFFGTAGVGSRIGKLQKSLQEAEEAAATGSRVSRLSTIIEEAKDVSIAGTKLAKWMRVQRVMMWTGVGTNGANVLLVGYDAYRQIRDIGLTYSPEMLKDYIAALGEAEGTRRFEEDRKNHIMSILARAAFSTSVAVVGINQQVRAAGQLQRAGAQLAERLPAPSGPTDVPAGTDVPAQTEPVPAPGGADQPAPPPTERANAPGGPPAPPPTEPANAPGGHPAPPPMRKAAGKVGTNEPPTSARPLQDEPQAQRPQDEQQEPAQPQAGEQQAPVPATPEQPPAANITARLQAGGHRRLLADLAELAASNPATASRRAAQLAQLNDRELAGLEAIARLNPPKAGWGEVLDIVAAWKPSDRADLLELVGDVAASTVSGLDTVLETMFGLNVTTAGSKMTQIQGGWGQLYAARTLMRSGGRNFQFEVRETQGGLTREYDIHCDMPGGRMKVEVKTNLGGEPSFNEWQVQKDLVTHAGSGYRDLLYMYHPSTAPRLASLRQRMVAQFANRQVRRMFRAAGADITSAELAFRQWVANGVTTYGF